MRSYKGGLFVARVGLVKNIHMSYNNKINENDINHLRDRIHVRSHATYATCLPACEAAFSGEQGKCVPTKPLHFSRV